MTGRRFRRRVRHNGPSSGPSALCRRRVLHAALPFTTGYLIVGHTSYLGVKTTGRSGDWHVVNMSVYLSQKVCIFISFITLFPFPDPGTGSRGQEAGTLKQGQGHREKRNIIAGTDFIHE